MRVSRFCIYYQRPITNVLDARRPFVLFLAGSVFAFINSI